jgi:transposase
MAKREGNFTRKQEKAISALLTTDSVSQAASVAGVGERTLYRWLRDSTFLEQYRKARKTALDQAISKLQERSNRAAKALIDIVENEEMPPSTRVMAAKEVLQAAVKGIERDTFEAKLEQLERLVIRGEKW